jgi:hypothetical protein
VRPTLVAIAVALAACASRYTYERTLVTDVIPPHATRAVVRAKLEKEHFCLQQRDEHLDVYRSCEEEVRLDHHDLAVETWFEEQGLVAVRVVVFVVPKLPLFGGREVGPDGDVEEMTARAFSALSTELVRRYGPGKDFGKGMHRVWLTSLETVVLTEQQVGLVTEDHVFRGAGAERGGVVDYRQTANAFDEALSP